MILLSKWKRETLQKTSSDVIRDNVNFLPPSIHDTNQIGRKGMKTYIIGGK